MSVKVKELVRVFHLKNKNSVIPLDDPNPEFSPEEVLDFYSNVYPELLNATFEPMFEDDQMVYEITPVAGTKG